MKVAFVSISLEQLLPRLGRELGIETSLVGVLSLLFVVQPKSKIAKDLPLPHASRGRCHDNRSKVGPSKSSK